jgi:hypothetical protein
MATDHIVIGPGGRFQCNHCGSTHDPFKGGAVELWTVGALGKAFTEQHADCPEPDGELCHSCFSPKHASEQHVNATTKTPGDWIDSGDTGLSSKAIWRHMMGLPVDDSSYPLDPDDFGRCFRLLGAPWAKGWRERMPEMSKYGGVWAALVARWQELEALYRRERKRRAAPKLYAAMQECRRGGGE